MTNGIVLLDYLQEERFRLVCVGLALLAVEQMLDCTDECIQVMFISHSPQTFVQMNMDYYVISSLMKAFRNILTILTTKPKFQVLRDKPHFVSIVYWYFVSSSVHTQDSTEWNSTTRDWIKE